MNVMGWCIVAWMIGNVIYFGVKIYLIKRDHKRKMLELDEVDRHTAMASRAKTSEEYEFHMREAVRKLDVYSSKSK